MHLHLPANLFGQFCGNVEGPGLAVQQQRDLKLRMQIFAVRTAAVRLTALRRRSMKLPKSISQSAPRLRTSLPRICNSSSPDMRKLHSEAHLGCAFSVVTATVIERDFSAR
jgi:hypothetical protein